MPCPCVTIDTHNAILCTAFPVLPAIVGSFAVFKDKELQRFLKSQNFPSFSDRCKIAFALTNITASASSGYASYLLLKKVGGDFSRTDTKAAMGLYVAMVISGCCLVPTLKKQNIKAITNSFAVFAALATGTTIAFCTIDKISALWSVPFNIWAVICAGLTINAFVNKKGNGSGSQNSNDITKWAEGSDK